MCTAILSRHNTMPGRLLHTDASDEWIGGMLLQGKGLAVQMIAFFSHLLVHPEQKGCITCQDLHAGVQILHYSLPTCMTSGTSYGCCMPFVVTSLLLALPDSFSKECRMSLMWFLNLTCLKDIGLVKCNLSRELIWPKKKPLEAYCFVKWSLMCGVSLFCLKNTHLFMSALDPNNRGCSAHGHRSDWCSGAGEKVAGKHTKWRWGWQHLTQILKYYLIWNSLTHNWTLATQNSFY